MQSHFNELSENSKKGDACLSLKPEKEGRFVALTDDQNPGSEAPPRSKRAGNKGNARGGATARGAMEKSRYVRVNERE